MAPPTEEVVAASQGNGDALPKSKRAQRRENKKLNKQKLKEQEATIAQKLEQVAALEAKRAAEVVEYVAPDDLEVADNHPDIGEFKRIFGAYATPEELSAERKRVEDDDDDEQPRERKQRPADEEVEGVVEKPPPPKHMLSKRALKAASRLSIAELKQLVPKPDVVEYHDANSHDPKLLVHLKSYRNTVPVPSHWSSKRKYLQNKRGYEKPPFQLPAFIAETGITDIRRAQQDREDAKKAKAKMREKVQPKTNKIDIDYQVLHDAFFRHQKKPDMTHFGNLYYEGRELEVKLKAKRPGDLSEELKRALGMTDITSPPPWLYGMQRFGPPPAYPKLKIPGVNCPIPAGARYGFGPGEWGKPPVDEYGRPLYGDVFGTTAAGEAENANVDKSLWAVMQNEDIPEADEDNEDDNEDGEDDDMESAMESVSSITSTSSGMETPETLQLRKDAEDTTTEGSSEKGPKSLYTVLEEKKAAVGSALFGSQHTYVVPPSTAQSESEKRVAAAKSKAAGAVNVALNPEDLESLDAVTLKRKYEAQLEAENVSKKVRDDDEDDARQLKKSKGTAAAKDKKKQQKYKF